MQFREGLIRSFPEFYDKGDEQDTGRIGATQEQVFNQKWGWFTAFIQLAKGDFLRVEQVTKLTIYQALTYLAYMVDEKKMQAQKAKGKQ